MDENEIEKEMFKAFATGQAWIHLQKTALRKLFDNSEPVGIWGNVALECERKFKECQDRLRALIQEKEELTKKP